MNKYFRLHLTLILIAFSLVIVVVIAFVDFSKLKNQVLETHEMKIDLAENQVVESLHTVDNVYHFFDDKMASEMEFNSNELVRKYEENPEFDNWDFATLKKDLKMDIYIINDKNVITHSSYTNDIGLDFSECCLSLADLLDERRAGSKFIDDGMDIQQSDGTIKKFSYLPTPDHKNIIELSVSLEEEEIFNEFSFLDTITKLENKFDEIKTINVYNSGGLILGYMDKEGRSQEVSHEMRYIFEQALKTEEPKEYYKEHDKGNLHYRYIPYKANKAKGLSTRRVVEIVYDDAKVDSILSYYREKLVIQLLVIVIGAVILSFILARLVARPIYLAFHDSLTGLKNRAAFEDEIKKVLVKKDGLVALMMIDLDNFKTVNDSFGHAEGDRILKYTAKTIQEEVGFSNIASRVGGDEFVVVFTDVKQEVIEEVARSMIKKIKKEFSLLHEGVPVDVSISVGIAFAHLDDELTALYNRADRALYASKANGKNQYTFFEDLQ